MLGSSSIWGRPILLNKHQFIEWMEEVIIRVGESSLLWIELNTNRIKVKEHLVRCSAAYFKGERQCMLTIFLVAAIELE